MSYLDYFGFGGLIALTTTILIVGLLLKWTHIAAAFSGPLVAFSLIAFIILALAGMIRVRSRY